MDTSTKSIIFWGVLVAVAALLWAVVHNGPSGPNPVKATYSQFLQQVQAGQVSKATIEAAQSGANSVTYSLKNGSRIGSVLPHDYRDALEAMQQKMVDVEIRDASTQWPRVAANASPFLILLGFWFFMMNRMKANRDAK
jgi:cell division protease FtsH